jgi:hypothetical protein
MTAASIAASIPPTTVRRANDIIIIAFPSETIFRGR